MSLVRLTIIMLICCQSYPCQGQTCHRGHRLEATAVGQHTCVQCEPEVNFIPDDNHTIRKCLDCTKIENPELEIIVTVCNTTHDTEILCSSGYYRYKARNVREKDRCERCSECKNSMRVCGGYYDTLCCPSSHDAVVFANDAFICLEKSLICGPGQHLDRVAQKCLPCPEGTFMYDSNHTNTECLKCPSLSGNQNFHSVIVHECNITSPTVFGCKDGYFRDILQEPLSVEAKCLPCRKCQRQVRACDMYHDALCYNEDHMILTTGDILENVTAEMDLSLQTNQSMVVCEEGQYLYINITDGSSSCQPCDDVTEATHTATTNQTLQQNSDCLIKMDRNQHGKFRTYSIVLFIFAMLLDALYVFLYSRSFLRNSSKTFHKKRSKTKEKAFRMIGTVGIDLHFVLIFVHLFGTLCELGVVSMAEEILWDFTIAVVVITLFVFLADTILILFVKHLLPLKVCIRRRDQNLRGNKDTIYDNLRGNMEAIYDDDDEQTIIGITDI